MEYCENGDMNQLIKKCRAEADNVAEPPFSAAVEGVSGALLPLRPVVGGFVVEAPGLGTVAADAVSFQCSEGFSGDDCTSPASSPPQ